MQQRLRYSVIKVIYLKTCPILLIQRHNPQEMFCFQPYFTAVRLGRYEEIVLHFHTSSVQVLANFAPTHSRKNKHAAIRSSNEQDEFQDKSSSQHQKHEGQQKHLRIVVSLKKREGRI